MRTIRLELTNIETVRALHIYLAYMLDLPEYYGKNLDALYDLLTEIGEATRIEVYTKGTGKEVEAYLPRLLSVFADAEQDNPNISVKHE